LAHIPEDSLRLIGLRSGSIIAEFLVLPNVVEDVLIPSHSAQRNVEYLRHAVADNAGALCTLATYSTGPLQGCFVEFKDLGFAKPSIEPFKPVPEQRTQQQTETQDGNPQTTTIAIILVCAVAAAMLLLFALYKMLARSRKMKRVEVKQPYGIKVQASMEAGEPVKVNPIDEDDNNSTLCPSNDDRQSDIQSEQSFCVAPCKDREASKEQAVV